MPLHDTNIALFWTIPGLLRGVYKLIILFEDVVRIQGSQSVEGV